MGNIWDIEQPHPLSGRKGNTTRRQRKALRRQARQPREQDVTGGVNQLMNTASNFMVAGMGIAVMGNLGSQVISGLAKK